MSTIRLTFLYPHLFRTARLGEPAAQAARGPSRKFPSVPPPSRRCQCAASFATSTKSGQPSFVRRHGKAVEPTHPPGETGSTSRGEAIQDPGQAKDDKKADQNDAPPQEKGPEPKATEEPAPSEMKTPDPSPGASRAESEAIPSNPGTEAPAAPPTPEPTKGKSGPMEAILYMGPPEEQKHKPPHLTPPPYVHHFDSYSLVKQLETGGYTQVQAITAMKAVRALLAQNLDVAQESLVSKSDVENETYLFQAACSELSTEVKNNRRVAEEQLRQQRTHLQHEMDILTQSLNHEVMNLNDNVRGMFNDRKMAVREEQKAAESAIQQINYKISVELNSDSRSEIEGLRWVLIRRSVLGIIFMAVLTLGTLRYASYISHERQKEAEQAAREADALKKGDGKVDHTSGPDAIEILTAN